MDIVNKIFNVNGFGDEELVNTINFVTKGHKFYAYKVDAKKGIYLYLSQTLCPFEAIIFDSYQTIEEQHTFIASTLKSIGDTVLFTEIDDTLGKEENKVLGWRMYTELSDVDDQLWWKHYITIRPSYVLISKNNSNNIRENHSY